MNPIRPLLAASAFVLTAVAATADDPRKDHLYELRTYHVNEGKLDALHARFRDHTCALFEKHGIRNLAYWVPVENRENVLVYLVSYPSREARETSWKAFFDDPAWKSAYEASIKDGKLVAKVTRVFLSPTDYSPKLRIPADGPADGAPRLFEMGTYTANPGKLDALHARFRDHTCRLFEKHGMTNVLYTVPARGEEGAGNTLIYFLAHKDAEARDNSFDAFRNDPAWNTAREASERTGPLLVGNGVHSLLLKPASYSPLQ